MRLTDDHRGALFMVLAMAAFAVEDACLKAATRHVPLSLAMMAVGLAGAAAFALLAIWRHERPVPRLTRQLALRSGFEITGRLFYSLALAHAGLAVTSAILQATPLVVVLGAVIIFGERVGPRRWAAIALGLTGVLVILRPSAQGVDLTALFSLAGMLGFAGRDLATRAAPLAVSNAQLGVLGLSMLALAGVVLHFVTPAPLAMPPAPALLPLAGAAVFGTLAYGALTVAMRTGAVGAVTPFRYTRLVFALILAIAVFGERPDLPMLIGSAMIVGAGLFTLARSRRMV